MKYFFSDLINHLTFADSRLLRTIKLLVFKPGQLTGNYIDGVRVRYMKPLQLFFLANLLYFIFPIFQTYNTSLYVQMNMSAHSSWVKKIVEKKIDQEGISLEKYAIEYNKQSTNIAKILIILLAFIMAFPLWLMFFKQRSYFISHFLFGLEFLTFNLVVNTLLLTLIIFIAVKIGNFFNLFSNVPESVFLLFTLITSLYFLVSGIRRYYNNALGQAVIKSVIMIFIAIGSMAIYRLALFYLTYMLV